MFQTCNNYSVGNVSIAHKGKSSENTYYGYSDYKLNHRKSGFASIHSNILSEILTIEKYIMAFDKSLKNRYNTCDMKTNLHPTDYRPVVFSDEVAGFAFLTQSTAQTNETIKWEDGNEYPLVKMHISSASHPFFTGEEKIIDTEGRVDRFNARYAAAAAKKAEIAAHKAPKKSK
jgi:large subunit ribosomal protein L31